MSYPFDRWVLYVAVLVGMVAMNWAEYEWIIGH